MIAEPLVLQAFRQPHSIKALKLADWDLLIRQARRCNLLSSLQVMLDENDLLDSVPPQPREHLEWARIGAERHTQAVRWEVGHIVKALDGLGIPVMLLKGAAYVFAQLPAGRGRIFNDIDILVPEAHLGAVEASLMLHGWVSLHTDAYDQRYYRTWMHELPPMQHVKRETVIDVHHAIVPKTAPVHPDSALLLAAALPVDGTRSLTVLAPHDMLLHSAVHLFNDGEFDNGLRDLVDLHRLITHFSQSPSFWPGLVPRAIQLQLSRPLFYALRYTRQLLDTPIPDDVMDAAEAGHPDRAMLALMDQLFTRALVPNHASCTDALTGTAKEMLYVRANWLRMPPLLLARHLFHKAFISPRNK
ncbi:nucleotidyltransferase family protein [Noviherbaspirillum sp. ST9]|uniref:nucleotidyltransferase domain-containing protein n=1 Tax=Noviherbaspirillum sp. ST9 TaxID=3401606 RepID=UPI003B588DFB